MATDRTIMITIGADGKAALAEMGKVQTAMAATGTEMAGLESLSGKVTGAMGKLSLMFAGVSAVLAGGKMFAGTITDTMAAASEVLKLSKTFGITAGQASVLRVALDDAFLTVDDMQAGANRLTKQLLSNEDAFKKLGVQTRDNNGNYRNTIDIMLDVNSALSKIKAGTDQNVAGMSIYGKGWAEARQLMKLNAEAMKDAEERAKELNLVFGEEGLKQVKAYKSAMKDLKDVTESYNVKAGRELIPILTAIAVQMERIALAGNKIPKTFDDRLLIDQLHESVGYWNKLATIQRIVLSRGLGQFLPEDEQAKVYQDRKDANIDPQMQRAKYDKNNKAPAAPLPTDFTAKDTTEDWKAAHEKYLEYLKSFYDRQTAIDKSNAALQMFNNEQAFTTGLATLQQYLEKKQQLVVNEMDNERIAALKNLDARQQDLVAKANKADGGDAKAAADYHEALKKVEDADKALIEIESKLQMQRLKGFEDNKKQLLQEQFDKTAALYSWAAIYSENNSREIALALDFAALKASLTDGGHQQELLQIQREQEALEYSWAMATDSFQIYEQRKTAIAAFFSDKRQKLEATELQKKLQGTRQAFSDGANAAEMFYQLSGRKSKEALLAYQVMKSGETIMSGASSAQKAWEAGMSTGGPWAPIVAAAYAATSVAFTAAQLASIWSVSGDGSGGSVSAASAGSVTAAPPTSTASPANSSPAAPSYTIYIYGDGDYSDWDRIARDKIIPAINKARTDGV